MDGLCQICSSSRFWREEKKGSDLCPLSSFTFLPIYLYLHGQNEITWPESIPMFLSQVSTVNLPQATGQCGALMTRRAH